MPPATPQAGRPVIRLSGRDRGHVPAPCEAGDRPIEGRVVCRAGR